MGHIINTPPCSQSHTHKHKIFLLTNYILLGSASSCIFLTLSLRLIPSLIGFLFILLHVTTIATAVTATVAASNRCYAFHMAATVFTAIFQGSVSVLIFTATSNFLGDLKSYVREEDAAVILKLAGGLCVLIFCLEWVSLGLAFVLRYHEFVDGSGGNVGINRNNGKVQDEDLKDWPWPFQV